MSDRLYDLMEAGALSPLSYYFARFVARGCGADPSSVLAHSAALVSMRNLQGDVCVDLADYAGRPLFEAAGNPPLGAPRGPALEDWLSALRAADWVCAPNSHAPLILDGTRLYLGKLWRYEQQVATALSSRMSLIEDLDRRRLAQALHSLFGSPDKGLVDWQRVAAAIAAGRRFAVISGGPGTGKTTTVVKVLALLLGLRPELRIALAAPTGKAAARLSQAVRGGKIRLDFDPYLAQRIPQEAMTIHRLLEAGRRSGFKRNRDNPLTIDCLVVDEASMIDLPLMARLLDALPQQTRLILLGDRDQLASVEAGNVLGDITGHGREIRYSRKQIRFLTEVGAAGTDDLPHGGESAPAADAVGLLRISYRFGADSGIAVLSQTVNEGRGRDALALLEQEDHGDIAWLEAGEQALNAHCIAWAVERYGRYLRAKEVAGALALFEQSRVLAALRRGPFGIEEINRLIAARLQSQGLIQGGEDYRGKPILITANDYEIGLFNGDIGLLWHDEQGALRAYFLLPEGQVRSVSVRQLPEHATAYALTVHKSQGSEFDEVMLVLPAEPGPVVTRELIYTGVTRARRQVIIQSSREAFIQGCRARVQRSSALAEKLGWAATS